MTILERFQLIDQVAVVTGAGKGIGRGIGVALAEAGADVVVASRTEADLAGTVQAIESRGRRGLAVVTDVLVDEQRERLIAAAVENFGRLDVLVNNAGGTAPRGAMQTSERYFDTALHFNATQAFRLSQLAMPHLAAAARSRGDGASSAIVNISSRSADMVQTAFVAYGAGKAALEMMTRNLAAEVAPTVRVNAIGVGGVATDALASVLVDDAIRAEFEANTPMRRPGEVEDVAAAALYLASPASSWVTGKVFQVDGGTTAPAFSIPVDPI